MATRRIVRVKVKECREYREFLQKRAQKYLEDIEGETEYDPVIFKRNKLTGEIHYY